MLKSAYPSIPIGSPFDSKTLLGPVHNKAAVKIFEDAIKRSVERGGKVAYGGKVINKAGNWVEPTLIEVPNNSATLMEENFCPILSVTKFKTYDEAVKMNNSVP